MQDLFRIQRISRSKPGRSRAALLAPVALIAVLALAAASPAGAAGAPTPASKTCPAFSVLHNDRIGPAVFPAGKYTITLESASLDCKAGGELFSRFLEDFDGVLPSPWKVSPEASGKSSFLRGAVPGFSVELTGKAGEGGGTNPDLGTLCRNPFTVVHSTVISPLRFTKGKFLIYLPKGSGISCEMAVALFRRFLGASPNLPSPWTLTSQTATFYKPANPARSSFRIEPLAGAGRR